MEPINFKVASDEYQLLPHTGFDAIDLDRKVLGLIGKMARQGLDINDDVEAFALLANTLSELSTPDFKWLLETTLSAVTVVTKGQKFVTLDSFDAIAAHFEQKRSQMYAVMLQVWKLEKLSPFVTAPATEQNGA
jgi:hypothetical protein